MSSGEHEHAHEILAGLPGPVAEAAAQLLSTAFFCHGEVEGAWAAISPKERAAALADLEGPAMLAASLKVDHARVRACAILLADALETVVDQLQGDDPIALSESCDPLTVSAGGVGVLSVGGSEANCYTVDVMVSLDLGGGDAYTNLAGVNGSTTWVALALDHSGDDAYTNEQGSAAGGIGILVDASGNDEYVSNAPVGMPAFQASSAGGVGLLADLHGSDSYVCSRECQGFGSSNGGLGILFDQEGSDTYSANLGLAQGYGRWGAVGLLFDAGVERDTYTAQGSAQGIGGSTTLLGVPQIGTGIIVDRGGNDDYTVSTPNARASPASTGNAIFLDLGGTDTYLGPSPGADDTAWSPGLVAGAPPRYLKGKDCESPDVFACLSGLP